MDKLTKNQERVKLEDIGLYLKLIHMDYQPEGHTEMAELITEHFGVICLPEDIQDYEQLHISQSQLEDYEKLSRMVDLGYAEYKTE